MWFPVTPEVSSDLRSTYKFLLRRHSDLYLTPIVSVICQPIIKTETRVFPSLLRSHLLETCVLNVSTLSAFERKLNVMLPLRNNPSTNKQKINR